jgi:AraC-like DNA-binding protein
MDSMYLNILLLFIAFVLVSILLVLTLLLMRVYREFANDKNLNSKPQLRKTILESNNKYSRNGISKNVAGEFKEIIIEKMKVGEHYINPDFKLRDLAKLVSLSKHQTSLVLNQELQMDFNSFINSLRIEKAKEILANDKRVQISEVMYQVGFNNSTTFNRAFKKNTNLTPREFVALVEKQKLREEGKKVPDLRNARNNFKIAEEC